jgi:hypothetical protein
VVTMNDARIAKHRRPMKKNIVSKIFDLKLCTLLTLILRRSIGEPIEEDSPGYYTARRVLLCSVNSESWFRYNYIPKL